MAARAVPGRDDADALVARSRSVQATFALQQAPPAARSGDAASLEDGLRGYR